MIEFLDLQGRPLDDLALIGYPRLARVVESLSAVTVDAITAPQDARRLALRFHVRGQRREVPFVAVDGQYQVERPLEPAPTPPSLVIDCVPGKPLPTELPIVLEFGAPPWRMRLATTACRGAGPPEHQGIDAQEWPGDLLPVAGLFYARADRTRARIGDPLTLRLHYPRVGWRALPPLVFTAPDGDFVRTPPIGLVAATELPVSFAATFPAVVLLPALIEGGRGGLPLKPDKGKGAIGGEGPVPEDPVTPPEETPVTSHMFRADDNGAFWGEFFAGNTSFDAEEQRAIQEGWEDADENKFAEKTEILANLTAMDGDDIWVYSGHLAFRDPADRNLPTHLAGWSSGDYELIGRDEITAALGSDGGPGLVVVSGCKSYQIEGYFPNAKIYAGFDVVVDDKESDAVVKKFLQRLWDGVAIGDAEREADAAFKRMWGNRERQGTFRVRCADKTKTLYETLGVPRKSP